MEELHVLIDGDTSFFGGFFYGLFLHLESVFGLPIFALVWIIKQEIPCCTLVAIDATNDFASSMIDYPERYSLFDKVI